MAAGVQDAAPCGSACRDILQVGTNRMKIRSLSISCIAHAHRPNDGVATLASFFCAKVNTPAGSLHLTMSGSARVCDRAMAAQKTAAGKSR
ncbi:D-aminopeptidase [Anopheles sinensis]|uniref:D-aminopeptidase n=1 Tax=Anopheles sinensis TaxID=74873 RepID=A0A084WIY3_ANOSI|nr:D-aminopeptidase [Anopheles sinensis]